MYYGKMTSRRDTRRILCEENSANIFLNTNRTNLTNLVGCDMVYIRGIREITSLWSVGLRQISWSRTSRKRSRLQICLESLCIKKTKVKKSVVKDSVCIGDNP